MELSDFKKDMIVHDSTFPHRTGKVVGISAHSVTVHFNHDPEFINKTFFNELTLLIPKEVPSANIRSGDESSGQTSRPKRNRRNKRSDGGGDTNANNSILPEVSQHGTEPNA